MAHLPLKRARRNASHGFRAALLCAAATFSTAACVVAQESLPTPPQTAAPQEGASTEQPRTGPAHSYEYYREQLMRSQCQPMQSQIELGRIPTATGGYNYGFPMRPYRYGYFGAERSPYPRVMWHQRYYGDKTRTAYWQSY